MQTIEETREVWPPGTLVPLKVAGTTYHFLVTEKNGTFILTRVDHDHLDTNP